ncbi:expressed unknown protein [Seminavis robusta]|uniref:Uncharacterized protein n=1 Tax=Seminavis robusta TaxID=568900 RepID=A0A9N8H7T5_9STRA|nr:expressed unknown protein [Seminavis robusta]|eukprot:Sro75_g041100.1 n/a (375) ;mRNA; r:40621-41745
MSTPKRTRIVVDPSHKFHRQCEQIRQDAEEMKCLSVILNSERYHYDNLALLTASLGVNTTTQELAFALRGELEPAEAHTLGNIFRTNRSIATFSFHLFSDVPDNECKLQKLWQGVRSSTSLERVLLSNLPATSVTSFVEAWKESPTCKLSSVSFLFCRFSKASVDALIAGYLESTQMKAVSRLMFEDCVFEGDDKCRIACALAKNSSLKKFVFKYKDGLGKKPASMFAHAIATNTKLRRVGFDGLDDDALPIMTHSIEQNHCLKEATISGKNSGGETEKNCMEKVVHSIIMNRAGRRFLQESIQRPGDASIEEFWLSSLTKNINNHPVVYSWIRNYPDIFLRVAGFGTEEDHSNQKRKAGHDCKLSAKKPKNLR